MQDDHDVQRDPAVPMAEADQQQQQHLLSWTGLFGPPSAQPGPHAVLVDAQEGEVAVEGMEGGCNLCVGDEGVTLWQAQAGPAGLVFRR
jgi:hypothetical protein